jgi:predicted phosphatase
MKLRNKNYVMSVRCINKNVILDPYGSEIDMVEYDGTILKECRGYLVQGLPWNSVKSTLNPAYAWQASCCAL